MGSSNRITRCCWCRSLTSDVCASTQWADDWAVCAVDIPDAKCHWYVMAPDNTFGEGFDWEEAPWFDATGLNDVAPMQKETVVQKLQHTQ